MSLPNSQTVSLTVEEWKAAIRLLRASQGFEAEALSFQLSCKKPGQPAGPSDRDAVLEAMVLKFANAEFANQFWALKEEAIRALKNAAPQAETPSASDGQVGSHRVPSLPPARASSEAGADDTRRMDWLEDVAKVYWVTVQTQPHGEHIFAGQGKALREAIDDDMTKRSATDRREG